MFPKFTATLKCLHCVSCQLSVCLRTNIIAVMVDLPSTVVQTGVQRRRSSSYKNIAIHDTVVDVELESLEVSPNQNHYNFKRLAKDTGKLFLASAAGAILERLVETCFF